MVVLAYASLLNHPMFQSSGATGARITLPHNCPPALAD